MVTDTGECAASQKDTETAKVQLQFSCPTCRRVWSFTAGGERLVPESNDASDDASISSDLLQVNSFELQEVWELPHHYNCVQCGAEWMGFDTEIPSKILKNNFVEYILVACLHDRNCCILFNVMFEVINFISVIWYLTLPFTFLSYLSNAKRWAAKNKYISCIALSQTLSELLAPHIGIHRSGSGSRNVR